MKVDEWTTAASLRYRRNICLQLLKLNAFLFLAKSLFSVLLQYYHSVRVFAGQDPACVWVGWVTPDYHYYSNNFNLSKNRTVTVTLGDERGRVHER